MYRTTFRYGRKGLVLHAISGVEIALWDIIGKYRNLPVYEMIGGLCRDKIKAYASLHHYEKPEDVVTIAQRCVEQGYMAIKLHQADIESTKAVRDAVGPDIVLMVDAAGAGWTPRQAVEKSKELEQYGVLWLEEPVWPEDDYDGLAYVRDRSRILIAAGENEYTHYGFKDMITRHAVDIVQPDVTKSGGIMACRKIFSLAEAWNLQIATHSFYYGPGVAATIHLGLSNLRSEYIEINSLPLEVSIMQPPLRPEKGYLTISDRPGIGVEIDDDVVKKYRYTG
jgi:L-alanine-DL-glutamate epimerase-like enolase superfamily enzyme